MRLGEVTVAGVTVGSIDLTVTNEMPARYPPNVDALAETPHASLLHLASLSQTSRSYSAAPRHHVPGSTPPMGDHPRAGGNTPAGKADGAMRDRIAQSKKATIDQLRKEGVSESHIEEAANILVGQQMAESGINPRAVHDHGTGYGIYGARLERRTRMLNWMRENGYASDSLEGQARYMAHEAMTDPNYRATRNALLHADPSTRRSATDIVTHNFERPTVDNSRIGDVDRAAGVHAGTSADGTGSSQAPVTPGATTAADGEAPKAFIMHHTGGRGTPEGVQSTLRERGLGVEYIMDRDGNVTRAGGPGSSHMKPGWGEGEGLNNRNTVGMEVIANDDKDVTPAQVRAAQEFIRKNYPNTPVYGHGEVNPGHKEADEGKTIVDAIRNERAHQAAQPSQKPSTSAAKD